MSWRPYVTRRFPLAILFVVAVITVANYFVSGSPELSSTFGYLRNWSLIIFAYTYAVGLVQLTILRVRRAMNSNESMRRRTLSALFVAEMWFVTLIGAASLSTTAVKPIYDWISITIYTTLGGAQYGMIGWYITLACYRTLKMKRWDISLFTGICFIHLVANTPLVSYIIGTWWFDFSQWIYLWPSTAGGKALTIIAALGMISVGIRGILGMERGILGGGGAGG